MTVSLNFMQLLISILLSVQVCMENTHSYVFLLIIDGV